MRETSGRSYPIPYATATPEALHLALLPQALEHMTDHVHTDAGALPLKVGDTEVLWRPTDCIEDHLALFSPRHLELPEAVFELPVGGLEDEEQIVQVGPGVVLSLVPAQGGLLQGLVVAVLVLLDDAFEADVPADLEAKVVALEEQEQAGDPAVSVAEQVDAQEVEVEGGDGEERGQALLLQGVVPMGDQLPHRCGRAFGRHGPEPDAGTAVGVGLDDVDVPLFVLSRVTDPASREAMQVENGLFRDVEPPGGFVDELERVAVAAHLLFVAVAQARLAEDDGADPGGVDLYAFDPVGGDRALDQRMLPQSLQPLR